MWYAIVTKMNTEGYPMTFGQRLRAERKSRKLSQEELAKVLDTTKQAIYKYETGVVQNIPFDKLAKLADYFGVTSAYLMGWTDERDGVIPTIAPEPEEDAAPELPAALREAIRPVSAMRLPMLGNVACGEPIYAEEEHEFCVALAADGRGIDADFCLTASGDSMINARIFDGDILFIRKQEIVNDGEIAVVLIEDEATVKRVYYDRENNILTLVPENPLYRPMRYMGEELDHIRILGRVVAVQYAVK